MASSCRVGPPGPQPRSRFPRSGAACWGESPLWHDDRPVLLVPACAHQASKTLFDFIEMMHERGEPLVQALLDAGIQRLRPIMITVGATVLALIPLAIHGGPLWQPLCYAQIGGLSLVTFIEPLLVKVFYAICVEDLKIVEWEAKGEEVKNG